MASNCAFSFSSWKVFKSKTKKKTPENSTFSKLGDRYNSKIPTTYKRLPKGVEKRKKVKRNEESTGPQ